MTSLMRIVQSELGAYMDGGTFVIDNYAGLQSAINKYLFDLSNTSKTRRLLGFSTGQVGTNDAGAQILWVVTLLWDLTVDGQLYTG